jgi:hypothetical protein
MKKFVPSVTRILKDLGYIDLSGIPIEALETKRELGISVHDLCARLARGQKIDLEQFQGPLRDRAERFIWWMDFTKAKVLASEYRIHNSSCTGKPDLIVEIAQFRWIIDIKPTFRLWHRLQLAAYSDIAETEFGTTFRAVLELDARRHPRQVSCFEESDFDEWRRCIGSWYWRYRNGLIKVEK